LYRSAAAVVAVVNLAFQEVQAVEEIEVSTRGLVVVPLRLSDRKVMFRTTAMPARSSATLCSATASVDFVMSAQGKQQDYLLTFVLSVFEDNAQIVTRAASPATR